MTRLLERRLSQLEASQPRSDNGPSILSAWFDRIFRDFLLDRNDERITQMLQTEGIEAAQALDEKLYPPDPEVVEMVKTFIEQCRAETNQRGRS